MTASRHGMSVPGGGPEETTGGKLSTRAMMRGVAGHEETAMTEIFAQGDLLLERVADVAPSGAIEENADGAALVLAEGEETGHRHAVLERVTRFRDDRLAEDIPKGLYLGHI